MKRNWLQRLVLRCKIEVKWKLKSGKTVANRWIHREIWELVRVRCGKTDKFEKLLNSAQVNPSFKEVDRKEKPYCQTIIHPSSQSTGGLHKEVMCCWSNFRATLPSWREYMHIMAHNIPQIHPLSHKLSNLDIFYQQCFCVSFFLQKSE